MMAPCSGESHCSAKEPSPCSNSLHGKKIIFPCVEDELDRILEWYRYIDVNLDAPDYNSFEVESMEKEISHHFQTSPLRKYTLLFTDGFVSRFLETMGIKRELRVDIELFRRYARLAKPNIDVALALASKADHKEYTIRKMPFGFYWNMIWGNYLRFYGQYKNVGKNLKADKTDYTIADVEMPIKLLRLYFQK